VETADAGPAQVELRAGRPPRREALGLVSTRRLAKRLGVAAAPMPPPLMRIASCDDSGGDSPAHPFGGGPGW
jgi:hypothetical protein